MLNSKYGNILTMILIILAVTIVGIIGYFAYDAFHTNQINANAQQTLAELERATTKVKKKNSKTTSEEKANTNTSSGTPTNTTSTENPAENPSSLEEAMALLNTSTENPETTTVAEDEELEEPEKVYMEGYEVVGRLEIPKTKVDYPILGKLTKRTLEIGLSVAYGPGPNKVGNTIIYGHNYRNNSFFSNNKKLGKGDKVYITDVYGDRVEYTIYNIYQTVQSDAEYMKRETYGRREVSLQTCTNDSSGRIIIWATADPIVEEEPQAQTEE